METGTNPITAQLRKLLDEEAHLVGQELQDALTKTEALRLGELCATLDELDEMLTQHRRVRTPS